MQGPERDFFAEPLTRTELEELARLAGGVRAIFAFGSPSFKKLGRSPEEVGDEELVELALAEPRLLRRPLLVKDGQLLVGAKAVAAAS